MAEQTSAKSRGRLNQVIGEVISDKMDKTISVKIYRQVKHKKYGKYIRQSSVFKAHDEGNKAKVGDKVVITESRPMSKTKRWKLAQIVDQARQA
tara:strand:+ start:207 stop:488 length:282 start_codon:yes stop_codon:yes gene_type:complete